MSKLDPYLLRKWSRFIKVRDEGVCQMCAVQPGAGRVESHHIMPKALYPHLAFDLANGVCLCVRCHKGVVHAEKMRDEGNWIKFVPMFAMLMNTERVQDFNERRQSRIMR